MDIRDRVMGDMPDSFFHKIAGIVPGFTGYMDRERRRDADKVLRTYLAHQYSAQRDRLNRVQQGLVRARQLDGISEVDRLGGVLQRFIDRLNTATYGYSGMFDPVKVEAADLDQLYAFDLALTSGVDDVSGALGEIEQATASHEPDTRQTVQAALSRLSTVVDDLNLRLNQRADLLSTGRGVPQDEYNNLVNRLNQATAPGAAPAGYTPMPTPPPPPGPYVAPGPSGATSIGTAGGGEMARVTGGGAAAADEGTPTTNLNMPSNNPPSPGMSSMSEGNSSFTDMPSRQEMGSGGVSGATPVAGTAGSGIESASSPAQAPGAPGHDLLDGTQLSNAMRSPEGYTGEDTGLAGGVEDDGPR